MRLCLEAPPTNHSRDDSMHKQIVHMKKRPKIELVFKVGSNVVEMYSEIFETGTSESNFRLLE